MLNFPLAKAGQYKGRLPLYWPEDARSVFRLPSTLTSSGQVATSRKYIEAGFAYVISLSVLVAGEGGTIHASS